MLANTASTKALLVGVLMLTAGLAGCADSEDGGDQAPSFSSFEEAQQAPGTTWQPTDGDSSAELRLLHPSGTSVETGEHPIVFLLYDADANEPIEGVTFESQDDYDENCTPRHSFCALMPDMGHGASPEESPEHEGDGVYKGMTTFTMDGDWVVNVRPMIDGEVVEFAIELTASGEGESHGSGDGHDHEH